MKVNGYYISEWDNGIKIVSKAIINLETKEVKIGEHMYDYDFDMLDLEILNREFVTIDGEEYPCQRKCEIEETKKVKDDIFWYDN